MGWLKNLFAAEDHDADEPLWRSAAPPPRVVPKKKRVPDDATVDFAAGVSGRIVDGGPGKNVLIRNKYVREDTGTHETLKILDDSVLETPEEFGADPYNTGRFDRSKSWDSFRTRK